MRKLLISIFVLLAAGVTSAQTEREEAEVVTNSSGYKLLRTRGHNWLWGFGATTPPSTFNSENIPQGAAWLNTSTGLVSIYGPSGWTSAAGGAASSVAFADVTTGTNTVDLEMSGQVNISGPDAATNVEIGSVTNNANAGTGGTSVAIGNAATNSGNGASNIVIAAGTSGTVSASGAGNSGNIYIGQQGSVSGVSTGNAIAIGTLASASAGNAIAIGQSAATAAASSVGIGVSVVANGVSGVTIGNGANAGTGANSITIGQNTTGAANAITFGAGGTVAGAANTFVAAFPTSGLSNVYFGRGITSTTADAYTIHGTGGSGADNAGGALKLAGGFGTGTAAGGDLALQRSPSIATGSTAQTATDAFYVRSQKKALVAATPTTIARISVPQGVAALTGWTGGTLFFTVVANDATDFEAHSGSVAFAFINEAGTESCNNIGTATTADTSGGSLTVTVTGASNAADTCDLLLTAASGLTETTLAAFWSVVLNGPGAVNPQ